MSPVEAMAIVLSPPTPEMGEGNALDARAFLRLEERKVKAWLWRQLNQRGGRRPQPNSQTERWGLFLLDGCPFRFAVRMDCRLLS